MYIFILIFLLIFFIIRKILIKIISIKLIKKIKLILIKS